MTLGKQKSFQYVPGVPRLAYNPFVNEEERDSYFDFEQAIILDFWVERVRELGMITSEQLRLGIILEERVVKPSVPKLEGQVSFECGSWESSLKTSLVTMSELVKPSCCPNPNAGLRWDLTTDVELEENDDEILLDLAVIHHLLALDREKQREKSPTGPSEGNLPSYWMETGTCLASSCGLVWHVGGVGHGLETLAEKHCHLAKLYVSLSVSVKSEMELIAGCQGVTEVKLVTALGFYSMTSSVESLERIERAHELVTALSVEVFPGSLQTEQKIGSWREALENKMNLKHSEGNHKTAGSKYLVGSSAAPYCKSKYPTHLVVVVATTQHRLIDQLFSVPKWVRLSRISEKSHELLAKNLRAVPEGSRDELEEIVGEDFMKLGDGNISEFQKKKASGTMSNNFYTIDEKDETHQTMMEIEPLLIASGYRTLRNIY